VAGTYTSAQSVTISDTTTGATIYYTTNGTTPTRVRACNSGAIPVSSTEPGGDSNGQRLFRLAQWQRRLHHQPPAAIPTFSPVAGTYTSAQSVPSIRRLGNIYYTTTDYADDFSSTKYTARSPVSSSETLEAMPRSAAIQQAVASAGSHLTAGCGRHDGLDLDGQAHGSTMLRIRHAGTPCRREHPRKPRLCCELDRQQRPSLDLWREGEDSAGNFGYLKSLGSSNRNNGCGWAAAARLIILAYIGTLARLPLKHPGSRYDALAGSTAAVISGFLGDRGFGATFGYLNDLWMFNPSTNQGRG